MGDFLDLKRKHYKSDKKATNHYILILIIELVVLFAVCVCLLLWLIPTMPKIYLFIYFLIPIIFIPQFRIIHSYILFIDEVGIGQINGFMTPPVQIPWNAISEIVCTRNGELLIKADQKHRIRVLRLFNNYKQVYREIYLESIKNNPQIIVSSRTLDRLK